LALCIYKNMPELPEIETIRNGLRRFILNKKILKINLIDPKLPLKSLNLKFLQGNSVVEIKRFGKLLVFNLLNGDNYFLVHLKMTGQLIFCKKDKDKMLVVGGHSEKKSLSLNCKELKHLRLELIFDNGDRLALNDTRRFAYVRVVSNNELDRVIQKFGIEPMSDSFSFILFSNLLDKRPRKNIKAFLLDQSIVAGIGNIYADEILFDSRISPLRKVGELKREEKKALFKSVVKIIKLAVEKKGTTFSDYFDVEGKSGGFLNFLKVYGKGGELCLECGGLIKKIKIAGRGTHYCPRCQS
jgi:formamidopyrimidine-DNA glycosylase